LSSAEMEAKFHFMSLSHKGIDLFTIKYDRIIEMNDTAYVIGRRPRKGKADIC